MKYSYFLENPLHLIGAVVAPLALDHVIAACCRSTFPLFQLLPVELYPLVTQHLSYDDLKSFALVDRCCLQLARSVMFCSVIDPSASLIDAWITEGNSDSQSDLSIGSWVRQLAIIDPYMPDKPREVAFKSIFTALHNLTHLTWNGIYANTTPYLLEVLMSLPLRALSLDIPLCGSEGREHSSNFPRDPVWRLELLSVLIRLRHKPRPIQAPNSFLKDFVLKIPPSLQALSWQCSENIDMPNAEVAFPHLYSVAAAAPNCLPLTVFAGGRIEHLSLDITLPSFLAHGLHMPTLRKLEWLNTSKTVASNGIPFLQSHPQLEFFSVNHPLSSDFLETKLLPLLATEYHLLLSLRLVFDDSGISACSLSHISHMTTIRALWLSFDFWPVDHERLLNKLAALVSLQDLAFTGDTYRVPSGTSSSAHYYELKMMPIDVDWQKYITMLPEASSPASLSDIGCAWELWHVEMMVGHAETYSRAIPTLRECFIGQLAMEVDEETRLVSPLSTIRCGGAGSIKQLKRKWGLYTNPWEI